MPKNDVPGFCNLALFFGKLNAIRGGGVHVTAVQKLVSVPIFELRVCMLTVQDAQVSIQTS